MVILMVIAVLGQTAIEAGPAQPACGGQPVTLEAVAISPPAKMLIQWDDGGSPGRFLVVMPIETTSYRVTMTDLDSMTVYEDTTTVFVHPDDPDLNGDAFYDGIDWLLFYADWSDPNPMIDLDPSGDGEVTIVDWFYFCNFDQNPVNTPPVLLSVSSEVIQRNGQAEFTIDAIDNESTPLVQVSSPPDHGMASVITNILFYTPASNYVGPDSFEVVVTDGQYTTDPVTAQVTVELPDLWADLYNEIFFVHCKACHIDASEGGLMLDTYMHAQEGGNTPPGFIPGDPNNSRIYIRVLDDMPLMAPPLSQAEKDRIYDWILNGAPEF